jgi:hypothetical protein
MATSQALELGKKLVELCRSGKNLEAIDSLYSKDIISVEATPMPSQPAEMRGLDAIRKKNQMWMDEFDWNSGSVSEPMVHGDRFSIFYTMDVTNKKTGKQMHMEEIGLYTVKDNKIIKEEFFYH